MRTSLLIEISVMRFFLLWRTGGSGSGRKESLQGKSDSCRQLFCLIVFDNIGNGAVQDIAEYIQCLRGDGLAFLHAVNGVGGNTMLKDQFVFCYVLTKQSFKEWFV